VALPNLPLGPLRRISGSSEGHDHAIIPLKERMDDVYFDPIRRLLNRSKAHAKSASSD